MRYEGVNTKSLTEKSKTGEMSCPSSYSLSESFVCVCAFVCMRVRGWLCCWVQLREQEAAVAREVQKVLEEQKKVEEEARAVKKAQQEEKQKKAREERLRKEQEKKEKLQFEKEEAERKKREEAIQRKKEAEDKRKAMEIRAERCCFRACMHPCVCLPDCCCLGGEGEGRRGG